jgi:RNA polymerase sigma-70 factor (ECF subfamily)
MSIEVAALAVLPDLDADPRPDRASDRSLDRASDLALVRQVIAGSHEAIASLYDLYGASLFRTAMRSCGDRLVAADVVQETFLALWNRAEQFDPARGSLIAWLSTIARNRTIDHMRAAGRRIPAAPFSSFGGDEADDGSIAQRLEASGELVAAATSEPLPDVAVLDEEDRATIAAGLATLGEAERQVILLAYQEGLTQSEIAARLGWPLGTVKTRTRRAHRQLRDLLEQSPSFAGRG